MLIPVRKFYVRKENPKKLSYAVLLTGQDITSYNNTSFVLFFTIVFGKVSLTSVLASRNYTSSYHSSSPCVLVGIPLLGIDAFVH